MASGFRRTSFRRSGFPRLSRPRAIKPPSLASLVEVGNAGELQRRLCGSNDYSREVRDDKFWDKQWAALLRKACVGGKTTCLDMLLDVCRRKEWGGYEKPPLPKQFISWLIKGADNGMQLHMLDDRMLRDIYSRLAQSEVSISAQDGVSLIRRGGAINALYQTRFGETGKSIPMIRDCESFALAWKKWRVKKTNIEIALDTISNDINGQGMRISPILDAVEELVEVQKPVKKKEILAAFHETAEKSLIAICVVSENIPKMLRVIRRMKKLDCEFDEDHWESWHARVCRSMEGGVVGLNSMTTQFINMVVLEYAELDKAPKGFFLSEKMLETLMKDNHPLKKVNLTKGSGGYVSHSVYEDAATWLASRKRLWDKLEEWGVVSYQDRAKWKALLNEEMGQDWISNFSRDIKASNLGSKQALDSFKEWMTWELACLAPDRQQLPSRKLKM